MHENNELDVVAGQDDRSELRASAACLVAYLDTYPASGRAFSVLRFVAQETMKRIDARLPHHINNFAIQTAVKGCADHDPSGWLSPIWKKIESDILPKREQGLQDFARGRGMTAYPWVAKTSSSGGAGNQAHYHLVTRAMPCTQAPAVTKPPDPDITYIRLEILQPSWTSRRFFGKNLSLAGGRKFMFVLSPLAWLAFAIYPCWYAWNVVSSAGASPGVGNVLLALLASVLFLGRTAPVSAPDKLDRTSCRYGQR
ncbi:MAG: hypothetical protein JNJ60_14900 [Rhodocyclaceae bacterium]|nr:hypothetical protein [Rhodocyclaceae bacterium]